MASSNSPFRVGTLPRPGSLWAGAKIATALMGAASLIRLLGLRRAARLAFDLADRLPPARESPLSSVALAAAHGQMIARVAEGMPVKPRCLPRALVLAALLRRRGIAAELWLGAGTGERFDAHAWIEIDGVPICEAGDIEVRYRRLWHLPTRTA